MRGWSRLFASVSIVLTIGLIAPTLVRAADVADVVALTTDKYTQTCATGQSPVTCTGPTSRIHVWLAVITPDSGPVTRLRTDATMFGDPPMDPESVDWMTALHTLACGDGSAVAKFVSTVAGLMEPGAVSPSTVGPCTLTGGMALDGNGRERYRVVADVQAAPTPTPTPQITPAPTPKQTPKPTPKPTPSPQPTDSPTAGNPTPSPSLAPSPSPSAVPATAAPTVPPEPTAASPTFVPTQEVAAATDVPAASEPPFVPAPKPPTFSDSVLAVGKLNTDGTAVGASLALALLLLLVIGFAGELFNNTVENNYTTIAALFAKGPLGRISGWLRRHGRGGVLLFIALTALISSFVDPSFGLDLRSLAEFLGFLVGLIVVLASFKLPPMLAHRRKTGELGRLRPLPWALVIAALFVLVSRIGNLQPGYLYGIVLGAIFVTEVSDKEEGRETFYGSLWTLAAAALAWLGLTWVRSLGYPEDGFGVTLLSTAFAATLVAGLEATAFGLMPLRFMPGHAVYRWNRLAWALLFGLSVFAFVHILIGPTSGYVSELSPAAFIAALGVFAAFGALSIGTWLYFRFRSSEPV